MVQLCDVLLLLVDCTRTGMPCGLQVGQEYRMKMLYPGGSKDAWDMLHDFLGRPPSKEPFLRSKGLGGDNAVATAPLASTL